MTKLSSFLNGSQMFVVSCAVMKKKVYYTWSTNGNTHSLNDKCPCRTSLARIGIYAFGGYTSMFRDKKGGLKTAIAA